jgi:succinoglycan biosynthesis transport protein ExoP
MNASRKTSSSRGAQEKETAPVSFDYAHLLRLCAKHWMWLVGGFLVGAVGGYIYAAFQLPIYSAQATIEVPERVSAASVDDAGQPDFGGDMIKTFEQLLQTKDLSERVVKSEHLNENPSFLPEGVMPPVSEDAATGMLAGSIGIHIRPLTRLIDISVEHPSPQMAQMLANRLAEESVKQEVDQSGAGLGALSDELDKEADRLRQKLADSESALKLYEASHGIVNGPNGNPDTQEDARLKDLVQQYNAAQVEVTLLKERYGEQHPKLIQAEQSVEELGAEVDKAQQEASSASSQNTGYLALKSEAESDQAGLDSILRERQTSATLQHVTIPGLKVVVEATLPWRPVRPDKKKLVMAGGFIGLLSGAAFILGLYFIDSSLRTVSQTEGTLGLPVIAAIPILTESDGKSILPTFSDPQSFVAESFRGLRASLILHDREHPLKTVLVVSAIPGEGKSFCAANLAVAFAQAGLKTLLVDADLRLPTLRSYFNLTAESNGFTEVLAGRATLASGVVKSPIPTLALLLTTEAADSPAELLSGIRLPLLLDEAAQQYDRVVIDSAPLNAVSDTMLIMPKADAILLVIRAAQTPASECKAALQKISSSKMKPLGLILNYLAPHTLKSYSYGYSYGQKPKEKSAK